MKIIKKIEAEDRVGDFINEAFTDYAITSDVALNFEEYRNKCYDKITDFCKSI